MTLTSHIGNSPSDYRCFVWKTQREPYLKMRPAGDQANQAQAKGKQNPMTTSINDQHPHNLMTDGASGPTG